MSKAGDNNSSCGSSNKLASSSNGTQLAPLKPAAPFALTDPNPDPRPSQWNDPLVHKLQSMLTYRAHAIFKAAIQRLVGLGYPEPVAQAAISRTGFYRGGKDIAWNIASDALTALKSSENGDCMDDIEFDNLMEMAEYTMVELVLVLVQVKPLWTVAEAMWSLLLFDMDIVQACGVDGDVVAELKGTDKSNPTSMNISDKVNHLKNLTASEQAKGKPPGKTVAAIVEETVASKGRKPLNRKELRAMQKVFGDQIDLSDNKTIVGSALEDKKMKSPAKSLGVQKKDSKSKSKTKAKGAAATTEVEASEAPNLDTGIPFDTSTGKYAPRNSKEEKIVDLLDQIGELDNDMEVWSFWANRKVMEATARLNKDKPELTLLRQEKELNQQLKREQKLFEENAWKRVSDIQCSLVNADCHVELTNDNIGKLKEEKTKLFREMQKAKMMSVESSFNSDEAQEKEQEILKEVQSWNGKLSSLQNEIKTLKRNAAEIEQELTVSEKVHNRIRDKFDDHASEKEELLKQVTALKDEKEQLGASLSKEEKKVNVKAKADMEKYEGVVDLLTKEIAELKLKVEGSKITDLKRGMSGKVKGHKGLSHEACQRRERECVMCMSEEPNVVFLPCGHGILCKGCNELHKGQGMECPSCRMVIVTRVEAKFSNQSETV